MPLNELNKFNEVTSFYDLKLDRIKGYQLSILEKDIELYCEFLKYVKSHPNRDYYTVTSLYKVLSTTSIDDIVSVIQFFTKLIDVHYCYYEGDEQINITKESYLKAVEDNAPPVKEETGTLINPFDIEKLGFFCMLKYDLYPKRA